MDTIDMVSEMFSLNNKVLAITGGGGILGTAIAKACGLYGGSVFLLDLDGEKAEEQAGILRRQLKETDIFALKCNVLDTKSVNEACLEIKKKTGKVDVLINGAGGNSPSATTNPEQGTTFFDIPVEAFQKVFALNFTGAVICSQVFGKAMTEQKRGCIINIASMSAIRPLTRIPAYSSAKAALVNFTQWLAVDMAVNYSPDIRVNAIAPGFFDTAQNHYLLYGKRGNEEILTPRGEAIIKATPQGKFGNPDDLAGAVIWLASDASSFVTGTVINIDGGFSAFSGV